MEIATASVRRLSGVCPASKGRSSSCQPYCAASPASRGWSPRPWAPDFFARKEQEHFEKNRNIWNIWIPDAPWISMVLECLTKNCTKSPSFVGKYTTPGAYGDQNLRSSFRSKKCISICFDMNMWLFFSWGFQRLALELVNLNFQSTKNIKQPCWDMFISGFPPLLHNKGVVITLFGIGSNCPIDAIKHKRLSTVNSKDLCKIFVTANGAPVNALGPPRNQIPIASDPRSSGSCPQIPRRWGPSTPGCQKSAGWRWLEVSNYSKTRHLGWIFPPAPNTNTLEFFNVIVWLDMLSDIF